MRPESISPDFEVLLVRHGETLENKADTLQGCDPRRGRLSPRGVAQSRRLGAALDGVALDVAWCSPLERAVATLGVALGERGGDVAVPLIFLDDLREIDLADLHGRTRGDWRVAQAASGVAAVDFQAPGGGESWNDVQRRSAACFATQVGAARAAGARRALLVAHGGVLRGVLTALTREPMAIAWATGAESVRIQNGSISRVTYGAGRDPIAMRADDTRHLDGLCVALGQGFAWDPSARRWVGTP